MINDSMKNSILLAMEDDTLDFVETFEEAVYLYVESTGSPLEFEGEEEFIEFYEECQTFILDEVITNLILKEAIEIKGIEDGEFVYGLTSNFDKETL